MRHAEYRSRNKGIRADIQSLRALAVGLVVINHLWPGDLPGGYIGVDIFFVISGFLITSHLRREVEATGTIKLGRFWVRRAKRLLPAAILVLVASAAITYLLLPVTSARAVFSEIAAAGAYVLNWVLAASSLDYFAHDAASPVTHYWSLSVEEQFYIVWPILILLGLLVSRRGGARLSYWTTFATLAVVFGGSLAWAVWSVAHAPTAAYFQTTGRAWEFAAGGLLAFLPASGWSATARKSAISWALWVIIIACAFLYGPTTGFPGIPALIPVLATAALIGLGGAGLRFSPQHLFRFRPVQFVGDISYSVYLWHWPLIVAVTTLVGTLSGVAKVAILAFTLVLAWLTKTFVEDRVRFAKGSVFGNPWRVLVATAATVAVVFAGTTAASATIGARAQTAAQRLYTEAIDPSECFGAQAAFNEACENSHTLSNPDDVLNTWDTQNYEVENGSWCQRSRGESEARTCEYGVAEGNQALDIALVGDSHASMWAPALDSIADDYGLRVTTYLALGCAALSDPSIGIAFNTMPENIAACNELRPATIDAISKDPTIDVVVTTSADQAYFKIDDPSQADTGAGYIRAWNQWLEAGKRVIVLNDIPHFPYMVPECLANSRMDDNPCSIPADSVDRTGPLAAAAHTIEHPNFSFVDHWDVFCGEETCSSVIGGIPAYIDQDHLTWPFSRSFAEHILPLGAVSG